MSNTAQLYPVRIFATYPMFGDIQPETWFKNVVQAAQTAGDIDGSSMIWSTTGKYGIEYIDFWVETKLPVVDKDAALKFINALVRDTDGVVNYVDEIEEKS